MRSKEEELNKREAVLDSRTKILVDRENVLKNPREPNWPRCRPLLYHNIDADMTEPSVKRLVRFAYFGWLAFLVAVLWNFICMFAAIIVDGAVGDFILSIVFCVFLPPIFFLIYRILYRAGRYVIQHHYLSISCVLTMLGNQNPHCTLCFGSFTS